MCIVLIPTAQKAVSCPFPYKQNRQNQRLTVSNYMLTSNTVTTYVTRSIVSGYRPKSPIDLKKKIERSHAEYADSVCMTTKTITCTVCNHPDLDQIHAQLAAGQSQQVVADAHGLKRPAIQRHTANRHGLKVTAAPGRAPGATSAARNPKLSSACGKSAHDVQATLTEGFDEQDRAQVEARAWNLTDEELAAKVIELRKVCNRCGSDLLHLLPESFRSPYDRTNPLHEKQYK